MLVVVGLLSQKGGVGKSTLARAIAAAGVRGGITTRIADLDSQQVTVGEWGERRDDEGIEPAIPIVAVRNAAEALGSARQGDQLLVVDGAARTGTDTLDMALGADLIIQPCGAGYDDLDPAIRFFHELSAAGVPKDRLVVALCRIATEREEEMARRYIGKLGYAVLPGSIPEKASFRDAHNRGLAVSEVAQEPLKSKVDVVVNAIFERLTAIMKAKVLSEQHVPRRNQQ